MKNIFLLLFFLSVILCVNTISAQNSAQTQDFVNLGNRAVSKYTGRVEQEIPLCDINEFGFSIAVGLHYSSEGFKPAKRESEVGHNWFLNTGGAITRIVNGIEDERQDDRHPTDGYDADDTEDRINIDGYYTGILKHHPTKDEINQLPEDFSGTIFDTIAKHIYAGPENDPYELNPDEFQFNLGNGVSGKFFIDLDGTARVIPNGAYHLEIDITDLTFQRAEADAFDYRKPEDSQIVITLDNGYKYYFGGNYNYLQWISDDIYLRKHGSIRPVINTWNLAKIVAPNGHELVYEYYPYDINFETRADKTQKVDESVSMILKKEGVNVDEHSLNYNPDECTYRRPRKKFTYFVKKSNLKSIRINDAITANFYYKNLGIRGTRATSFLDDRPGHTLDRIFISGTGIPSKEVLFEYDLYETNPLYEHSSFGTPDRSRRPFLKSVAINNEEPYTFEYQITDDLPGYDSPHRNQYGYFDMGKSSEINNFSYGHRFGIYKNIYSGGQIVARILQGTDKCFYYIDPQGALSPVPPNWAPKGVQADIGLLHKITLPTKGSIEFQYDNKPYADQEPIQVRTVLYNDGKGNTSSKAYEVVRIVAPPLGQPPYGSLAQFLAYNDNQSRKFKAVREKLPNGAAIYSLFRIRRTGIVHQTLQRRSDTILDFPFWTLKNDTYVEEGKLIAELSFDADGKPLSKSEYLYDIDFETNNNRYDDYIPKVTTYKDGAKLNRIYLRPNFLREKRSYTFDPTTTKRFYKDLDDPHGLIYHSNIPEGVVDHEDVKLQGVSSSLFDATYHKLIERISYTEEHLKQKTTYTYPFAYNRSDAVIDKMMTNNILSPISEKSILENNGVAYSLGMGVSEYTTHNGIIVPYKNYQWSPNPNKESLTISGTQLYVDSSGKAQLAEPENTTIITYDQFSPLGVPYQVRTNTGEATYTMYTDADRKPILGITNASYAELSTIPSSNTGTGSNVLESIKNLEDSSSQVEEVEYLIDYLREHYPNARCSYTKYFTNNGLVNFTMDSRKQKTFYEYDNRSRLITTKDHEGNIINYTSYNTKK